LVALCMITDIDARGWLKRLNFLLHFGGLSVGHLLLFGCQCCLIAWPPVHPGPVLGTQLRSQPFGTHHAGRGGERRRTRCAPRRLVAVDPLVDVPLADHRAVVHHPLGDCASTPQQTPLCFRQRLQNSAALLAAESAGVLTARPSTAEAIHCTADSAAHSQHTHGTSASDTQCWRLTSHAAASAFAWPAPCVALSCCGPVSWAAC
jgi:hypothetical protein